ncbi:hypothetical protein BaRGS_00031299 [Batillaria attramentaria]|uniref:ABC transporter domain-containing protein n=1 Tax=Batillaria attramentaria TaxID=370345 RepID=A0ABD0JS38_9CAEN
MKAGFVDHSFTAPSPAPTPGTPKSPTPGGENVATLALQDVQYRVKYRSGPWWRGACFRKLHVKHVLNDVNMALPAGQLIGLVGSSGSGKTSLLDVIAFRCEGEVTGTMTYKGVRCTKQMMKQQCSYVIQADRLLPNLTVRETLTYAAYLKLPGYTGKDKIHETVENVINRMGLRTVADSRVGGAVTRGISGGEKRRLTIALQLLKDPDILLLDEPTTGLDSFTARHLVTSLQNLARQGTLVILSIHQPRSDIAHLLDQTALMCQGHVVYYGPTSQLVPYFTKLGFPCPTYANPMDTYIDVISIDRRDAKRQQATSQRVQELLEAYRNSDLLADTKVKVKEQIRCHSFVHNNNGFLRASKPSWFRKFFTIVKRMNVNLARDRKNFLGRLFFFPFFVPFVIMFLGRLGHSQTSIQDRIGLLYNTVQVPPHMAILNNIAMFPALRNHFYREGMDGLYSSATFLLAYALHITPFVIFGGVLFSSIMYWVTGMNPDLDLFGMHVAVVVILHLAGEFLTMAVMGLFRDPQLSNTTTTLLFSASGLIASGFLRSLQQMPQFLKELGWSSILKYASEIVVVNEFHNLNLTCKETIQGLACLPNGDVFLEANYPGAIEHTARNFQVLASFTVGYLLLAVVTFKVVGSSSGNMYERTTQYPTGASTWMIDNSYCFVVSSWLSGNAGNSQTTMAADTLNTNTTVFTTPFSATTSGAEQSPTLGGENVATLALQDVQYRVKYRSGPWWRGACFRKLHVKHVLNDVNMALPAGQLIGLVGSSGSGKTSLLDVIAFRTTGDVEGKMTYRGVQCTRDMMQQQCSYVIQADRLLPNLTVRETLTYTAYLKLPGYTSKARLEEKVDTVINRMGLRTVANSRVGGAVVRGISGGEKRRVTIAIQLLKDPDILLLDEPTTGLDSFTARHLVQNLQELARQGRLVVLSIHQPRSDIVRLLDQTALMCQGHVIYFGPTPQLVPYFTRLGHPCPTYANPLDTYIDVASIDRRNSDLQMSSTRRVQDLLDAYRNSDLLAETKVKVMEQTEKRTFIANTRYKSTSPGWFRVFFTIISRMHVNLYRDRQAFVNRFVLLPVFVPFIIVFLGRLRNNQSSIQDRLGLLYQSVQVPPYVGIVNAVALFPAIRDHFYREGLDGLYSSATFLLAYTVHIAPFIAVAAVLFSAFLYWTTGMNPDPDKFGMMVAVVVCLHMVGELLTVASMGVFRNPQLANTTTALLLTASGLLASGFLRTTQNMLEFLQYLSWVSIHKYSSEIVVANEFHNLNLTCDEQLQGLPCIPNGDVFIEANYPGAVEHIDRNFELLVGFTVGFLLLCMTTFRIFGLRVLQ